MTFPKGFGLLGGDPDDDNPGKFHIAYGKPGFVDEEVLPQIADAKIVAVYQSMAMYNGGLGHLIFLKIGPEFTHKTPPPHGPDGSWGMGWKYRFVGYVDHKNAAVVQEPPEEEVSNAS